MNFSEFLGIPMSYVHFCDILLYSGIFSVYFCCILVFFEIPRQNSVAHMAYAPQNLIFSGEDLVATLICATEF